MNEVQENGDVAEEAVITNGVHDDEPNDEVQTKEDLDENIDDTKLTNLQISNIDASEVDDDTQVKLKGDLIGETMYSESFVVKTLLRFNKLEWSQDLEEDLCFIWDMTVEPDVCDYLFDVSFPSLVCDVILTETVNRLTEILIGILSNICISKNAQELMPEQIDIVLSFTHSDDPFILIQVMRFIKVMCHNTSDLSFINGDLLDKICFILSNSMNVQLLGNAMDAICRITDDKKLDLKMMNGNLFKSCLEGFKTICDCESNTEFNIYRLDNIKSTTNHWLQILVNICTYVSNSTELDFLLDIDELTDEALQIVNNILISYQEDVEFELCCDDLSFTIKTLNYVSPILNAHNHKLFFTLLNIMPQLIDDQEFYKNICNDFVELLCYFISIFNVNNLKEKGLSSNHLVILEFIKNFNLDCSYKYVDNLNNMIKIITVGPDD